MPNVFPNCGHGSVVHDPPMADGWHQNGLEFIEISNVIYRRKCRNGGTNMCQLKGMYARKCNKKCDIFVSGKIFALSGGLGKGVLRMAPVDKLVRILASHCADAIDNVVAVIQENRSIPPDQQRSIFSNMRWTEARCVGDNRIEEHVIGAHVTVSVPVLVNRQH